MSNKIQIDVNRQQAVADLQAIQKGVESVGAAAKQASADIANSSPAGGGSGNALADADALIAKLDAQEAAANAAAAAGVNGFGKIGIAIAGVTAAVAAAKAAFDGFAAVVKSAAESGDADAQRLVKSVQSIGTAWEDVKQRIAQTSLFQNLTSGATAFNKELATTVSTLGHLAVQMEARKLGLDPEAYDAAIQKQLELNNGRKQMADVTAMLAEVEQTRRRNAMVEELKELKTVEEVTAAIQAEDAAIKAKTQTELADGTAIANSKARQIALEQRLKQVKDEVAQAAKDAAKEELDALKENEEFKRQIIKDKQEQAKKEKREADELAETQKQSGKDLLEFKRRTGEEIQNKQAEDEKKAALETATRDGRLIDELNKQEADAFRDRVDALSKVEDLRREAANAATKEEAKSLDEAADRAERDYDRAARAAEKASDRRIAAEKAAAAEERKKYDKSVNDLKDDVAPAAQEIARQAADPQMIARRLAEDARKKKEKELAEDDQKILEEQGEAALKKNQMADRRETQATGRKAYNQAQNQLAGRGPQGDNAPFSQSDISGAIKQNTDQMVTDIARHGQVSREMMDALSQMAQGFGQTANDLATVQSDIVALKQHVGMVMNQTQQNRRRAQMASSRP